jgi:mono/diheme cytochrome c family protein
VLPWTMLVVAVALVTLAAACGGGGGGGDDDDGGAGDPADEAAKALFAAKGCADCHGPDGEGDGQNPRSVVQDTRMIIQQFTQRVRNGRGSAMPAFTPEQITDAEIIQLHEWLEVER